MIFVYIGLPLLVLIIILIVINKKKDDALKALIYNMLTSYGTLDGQTYQIGNDVYHLHLIKINMNAELIINSSTMWEVHYGSTSRLMDQSELRDGYKKLVVVYPLTTPIKRYVNENEMVFISYKDVVHDMHIVRMNELELFLKGTQS